MRISRERLETFACDLLSAAGVAPERAALVAEPLVASNLRGVDSHGVQLLTFYLRQIEAGNVDIETDGEIVNESGGCLLLDGRNGLGQVIAGRCCREAVRLASAHGISFVLARESTHYGAAAYWAQKMADAGFIGITMCNASPLVAPWGGKEPRFGTNPICMAAPGPKRWLLDMATTTVAMGKIFKAALAGEPEIPPGWAMNSEGRPTTGTQAALTGLLMPLGGYKGSGLAMMIEILCGVLGGGAMSTQLGGIRVKDRPMRASQAFLAIDPGRFIPREQFEQRLEALAVLVKSAALAAGCEEVLIAGEPEWRAEQERRAQGIPLSGGVWKELAEAAARLGAPVPAQG